MENGQDREKREKALSLLPALPCLPERHVIRRLEGLRMIIKLPIDQHLAYKKS
ncbi:hypothetical protein ACFSL6_20755 [Paenibacillus thailandensis]|uniref:Uncharacterized protein n=1 Tax=Paenibacillus thailandensis TaxID=393250 RepID=A0ABW5R4N0_9BACL